MYDKLNITENHLQALALFTKGFTKKYYIREVQKLLNISPRTAQLILNDLEVKTVLESKTRGKIKEYKLKQASQTIDYLIFVEQYKKLTFLKTQPLIKELITKITPHIKGVGLIFGSYAKARARKDSDIDLLIIGNYDKKEVKRTAKMYNLELNIKQYTKELFNKGLKKDLLLKEVLNNHVVFSGIEEFIKIVVKLI
ncbi:hypothetical protein GF352_01220 [archaeon]|nr:hypothetical protein [archaeon]